MLDKDYNKLIQCKRVITSTEFISTIYQGYYSKDLFPSYINISFKIPTSAKHKNNPHINLYHKKNSNPIAKFIIIVDVINFHYGTRFHISECITRLLFLENIEHKVSMARMLYGPTSMTVRDLI